MKNIENIKRVLDQIESKPETWNQGAWHCRTAHCFAGWAQLLSGNDADDDTVRRDAREFLGFNKVIADYYFHQNRTLAELKTALEPFYDRVGNGRDGYNVLGYNRRGYDRYGYDKDGLNKKGFDRLGYDIFGYDSDGYDKNHYNRKGYNEDGYNKDGYDEDGLDIDGLDKNNKQYEVFVGY